MWKQIFYQGIPPKIFSISASEKLLYDDCNIDERQKILGDFVRQKSIPIANDEKVI